MKNRIRAILQAAGHPLGRRELSRRLGLAPQQRRILARTLEELVAKNQLVELRGARYALPKSEQELEGTLSLNRDGYGFVAPDRQGEQDIYVPGRHLGGAMDGDRVRVALGRARRGASREGRVVEVLERSVTELVGRFCIDAGRALLIPWQSKDIASFEVASKGPDIEDGQLAVARIEDYPAQGRPGRVRIVKVLGDHDDPWAEVQATAHRHGLPVEFGAAALAEAEAVDVEVRPRDLAGRRDLRDRLFVTIDGETARDFDDAVALDRQGRGFRLWVAIADVSAYVRIGSELDREAFERGTSVYFPGICLPMLPERLSNGICSLNPEVDRLVMVAETEFDPRGQRVAADFYPAVIRSRGRLTYTRVQAVLDGDGGAVEAADIRDELRMMAELTRLLNAQRERRGSLDFELPEAEVQLDEEGRPVQIRKAERLFAHRLIEEFMLAANEAVASYLEESGRGLLFRVHEPPDQEKLEEIQQFAAHFNHGLRLDGDRRDPKPLQQLLEEVKGEPEEAVVNQVLLRAMNRARYSAENYGHFGLAAASYCHFTSPIRRYPDLVVHRALRRVLQDKPDLDHETLAGMADDLSFKERRAMDAERDLVQLKKCQFMAGREGEVFSAVIASVHAFGLFVELREAFVEGLVHIASLTDDYYHFDEDLLRLIGYNRRRIFRVGDELDVILQRVDLERREIDFALAEVASGSAKKRSGQKS